MFKNIVIIGFVIIGFYIIQLFIDANAKIRTLEERLQHSSDSLQDNSVDSTVLELRLSEDSVEALLEKKVGLRTHLKSMGKLMRTNNVDVE